MTGIAYMMLLTLKGNFEKFVSSYERDQKKYEMRIKNVENDILLLKKEVNKND